MSLPFFDTLQECFPQSLVDIIAKESIQEVFRHHPVVQTIHPFSKSQVKGLWGLFEYGNILRKYGPYDLFITLPSSFSSALIGYGVGSIVRTGYRAEGRTLFLTHSFPPKHGIHRAHEYRHLLKNLQESLEKSQNGGQGTKRYKTYRKRNISWSWPTSVPRDESVKKITFPFSEKERRTSFLKKQEHFKYVVFNVNAEAQSRRLPLEKWIALGNCLLKNKPQEIKIVFIGTPRERPRVAEVIQALEPKKHLLDFSGKTSVRDLAMLLRDADVVVSNDSGPMHLANAVSAPLVTFIGAADPVETEPFNKANTLVINKHLACSPCVKNVCKFPTVRCLEQITVDEIYQSVLAVMRET
jgi:lipopolysaccharide heptosyltransferase II